MSPTLFEAQTCPLTSPPAFMMLPHCSRNFWPASLEVSLDLFLFLTHWSPSTASCTLTPNSAGQNRASSGRASLLLPSEP